MLGDSPPDVRIYRFRHFSPSSAAQQSEPEEIIRKRQLWCSSPNSFNDPFDCNPNAYVADIGVDEQIKQARSMLERRNLTEESPEGVLVMGRARAGGFNSATMKDALKSGMLSALSGSSVCCFSSDWRSPAMWAYYADSHQGYSLAFKRQAFEVGKGKAWQWPLVPVVYVSDRPKVDLAETNELGDRNRLTRDLLYTKSDHWRQEDEMRVVRWEVPAGLMTYPEGALAAVLLGVRISKPNRDRLLAIVASIPSPVPVFELRLDESAFDFESKRIA